MYLPSCQTFMLLCMKHKRRIKKNLKIFKWLLSFKNGLKKTIEKLVHRVLRQQHMVLK